MTAPLTLSSRNFDLSASATSGKKLADYINEAETDFLNARPPRTWPRTGEFAGGILAYFEIDWQTLPGQSCQGDVRCKRPPAGTGFDWEEWVVRKPSSDRCQALYSPRCAHR